VDGDRIRKKYSILVGKCVLKLFPWTQKEEETNIKVNLSKVNCQNKRLI
jgi:hypothetical protein